MGKKQVKFEEKLFKAENAKVKKWLIETGDDVEVDDPILLIETSKEEIVIKSTASGELKEKRFQEGDLINIGDVFAEIEDEDEDEDDDNDDTGSSNNDNINDSIEFESLNQTAQSLSYPKTILAVKSIFKSGLFYFVTAIAIISSALIISQKTKSEKNVDEEKKIEIQEKKIDSLNFEKEIIKPSTEKINEPKKDVEAKKIIKTKKVTTKPKKQAVTPKIIKKEVPVADVPFSEVDEVPIFPGCEKVKKSELKNCFQEQMNNHIRRNFRYPEIAQEQGIQGRVYINFIISEDGSIINIRLRGPDKTLEDEAYRIISLLPKMKPGKHKGSQVRVPFSIPITFRLQ